MQNLNELVESVDLSEIIHDYYPESGIRPKTLATIKASWRGDADPSFSVFKNEKGITLGKDWSQGIVCNSYQFLTDPAYGISMAPKEAIKELQRRAGGVMAPRQKLTMTEAFNTYREALSETEVLPKALNGKGFSDEDIHVFGFANLCGDAAFAVRDEEGNLVSIKKKLANPKGKMRYTHLFSHSGQMANYPWISPVLSDADGEYDVLVQEGDLNAMITYLAFVEAGLAVRVIGMPGADSNILPQSIIAGRDIFVYADADKPGDKARDKWTKLCQKLGARSVSIMKPLKDDACDIAEHKGKNTLAMTYQRLMDEAEFAYEEQSYVSGYSIQSLLEAGERYIEGHIEYPSGFTQIDEYTLGFMRSEMHIVAALSSVGKSVWAHDVALYNACIADKKRKTMIFTPDQSVPSLGTLFASKLSGISGDSIAHGVFDEAQLELYGGESGVKSAWLKAYEHVMKDIFKHDIYVEDKASDFSEAREAALKAADEGVELFIFDYLQAFSIGTGGNIYGDVTKTSKAFKELAKELDGIVICTAQLSQSKFGIGRRNPFPTMFDIKDSGQILQDGYQIFTLYNWEYHEAQFRDGVDRYDNGVNEAEMTRCYVSKNKGGKAGQFFYLNWEKEVPRFSNVDL